MTWEEFKQAAEDAGIKPEYEIEFLDTVFVGITKKATVEVQTQQFGVAIVLTIGHEEM